MPEQPESLTFAEMLEKVREINPYWPFRVQDIIRRNPDLLAPPRELHGSSGVELERLVGIALIDFVCWAYGQPHLGYTPSDRTDS